MPPTSYFDALKSTFGLDWPEIEAELDTFTAKSGGISISRAGKMIKANFISETYAGIRDDFCNAIYEVYLKMKKDEDIEPPLCSCPFHTKQFDTLKAHYNSKTPKPWISTLLEVVWSHYPHLRASLNPEKAYNPKGIFSHFMLLDSFISRYRDIRTQSKHIKNVFKNKLSPGLSRRNRMKNIASGSLGGKWLGSVGGYKHYDQPIVYPCRTVTPYFTDTKEISSSQPDRDDISTILLLLGWPFLSGKLFIELQYKAESIEIQYSSKERSLAVPTLFDSSGKWEYVVDRDSPVLCNYTRDLNSDSRGLPEWICSQASIESLHDAIVWPFPTNDTWTTESKKYS